MERSEEENYKVYKTIGMYLILIANAVFFMKFLFLLFPYIDY